MQKAGLTLVETDASDGKLKLIFRVRTDDVTVDRWRSVIADLLGPEGVKFSRKGKWDIDISQVYFVRGGRVLYLWRAVITGRRKTGAEAFGAALGRSLSSGAELMEVPLVGQIQYTYDPAEGKIKGGHSLNKGAALISSTAAGIAQ